MKKLIFFIVMILFFQFAFSLVVKVDVRSVCQIDIKSFNIYYDNIPYIQTEVYNSGSLPLKARVFLDSSAKYWSKEVLLNPGEIINFKLPFISSDSNKIKIFYCSSLLEKEFNTTFLSAENLRESEDFKIVSVRSYGSYLVFDIDSKISSYLYILPSEYPENWIIEHIEGYLKKGKNIFRLSFNPLGNEEIEIGVYLLSYDGSYRYQKVKIEKPIGLKYFFYFVFDHFYLYTKNLF